jgi:hypothetical protein
MPPPLLPISALCKVFPVKLIVPRMLSIVPGIKNVEPAKGKKAPSMILMAERIDGEKSTSNWNPYRSVTSVTTISNEKISLIETVLDAGSMLTVVAIATGETARLLHNNRSMPITFNVFVLIFKIS